MSVPCCYLHSDVEEEYSTAENSLSLYTCSTLNLLVFSLSTVFPFSPSATLQCPSSFNLARRPLIHWSTPFLLFLASFDHFLFTFPPVISTLFQPGEQTVRIAFKECFEVWSDSEVERVPSLRLSCCCTLHIITHYCCKACSINRSIGRKWSCTLFPHQVIVSNFSSK